MGQQHPQQGKASPEPGGPGVTKPPNTEPPACDKYISNGFFSVLVTQNSQLFFGWLNHDNFSAYLE